MTTARAVVTRSVDARRWALPVAVTTALAAGTVYTAVRDPHQPGFFPSCIFYEASGFYCPGCGGLRAVHDLTNGDLVGALHMNPVVVLGVLPALTFALAWWIAAVASDKVPRPRIPTWLAITIPAFLGVFWVVRNLPGLAPYLSPISG